MVLNKIYLHKNLNCICHWNQMTECDTSVLVFLDLRTFALNFSLDYLTIPEGCKKVYKIMRHLWFVVSGLNYGKEYKSLPVWPDAGVKRTPIFSKSCPKTIQTHQFNVKSAICPKLLLNIWAIFARNFKKSPNLVTTGPHLKPFSRGRQCCHCDRGSEHRTCSGCS